MNPIIQAGFVKTFKYFVLSAFVLWLVGAYSQAATPTPTKTKTKTPTRTFTPTKTSTPTKTATPIFTRTKTLTRTPTFTKTPTKTFTPIKTKTPTFTVSYTPTFSNTSTPTDTWTDTLTPSLTPTSTMTSTATPTATITVTSTSTSCRLHPGSVPLPANPVAPGTTAVGLNFLLVPGFGCGPAGVLPLSVLNFSANVSGNLSSEILLVELTQGSTVVATTSFNPAGFSFTGSFSSGGNILYILSPAAFGTVQTTLLGAPFATGAPLTVSGPPPTVMLTPTFTPTGLPFTPTAVPVVIGITLGPASPSDSSWITGSANVPMMQIQMTNPSSMAATITQITLLSSGTGNDQLLINNVSLYADNNANGIADGGDVLLATGTYGSDNGPVTLNFSSLIPASSSLNYLVVYKFGGTIPAGTYQVSLPGNGFVHGTGANFQTASFTGAPVTGAVVTIIPVTNTPTSTLTSTLTPTGTWFTSTMTNTFTLTPTQTPSNTLTITNTGTPGTPTFTNTPNLTLTGTPTSTVTSTATGCAKTLLVVQDLPQNPVSAGVTAVGFNLEVTDYLSDCSKTLNLLNFSNTTTGNLDTQIQSVQLWSYGTLISTIAYSPNLSFSATNLGPMSNYTVDYVLSATANGVISTQLTAVGGYVTDSHASLFLLSVNPITTFVMAAALPMAGAPLTVGTVISNTATNTITQTYTPTNTGTSTNTPTGTWFTSTPTRTNSFTYTVTGGSTATNTITPTQPVTFTMTPGGPTDTPTGSVTVTFVPTNSPTNTAKETFTGSFTNTSTSTPTITPTAPVSLTPVPTPLLVAYEYLAPGVAATVALSDGSLFTVPTGALAVPVSMIISKYATATAPSLPSAPQFQFLSSVYFIDTDGVEPLAGSSVTITFPYSPSDIPSGETAADLEVIYYNGTAWVNLPTIVNTSTQTVTVVTDHFSWWAVVLPQSTPVPPASHQAPVLFPNPVNNSNFITIRLNTGIVSDVKVQVYTLTFRKIQEFTLLQVPAGGAVNLLLADKWNSALSNGLYYVRVTTAEKTSTLKLLVTK